MAQQDLPAGLRRQPSAGSRKKRLRRRAEWYFSGGAGWCTRCRKICEPCAEGKPDAEGKYCPYHETKLQTVAGMQAWDVLCRVQTQVRAAQFGDTTVIGLDIAAALAVAGHLGYDVQAVCDLLQAAEAGLIAGLLAKGPSWQSQ